MSQNKQYLTTYFSQEMGDSSSSSISSSSSSGSESRLSRLNRKFRSTIKRTWSFKKKKEEEKNMRQRSHSDIGMYGTYLDPASAGDQSLQQKSKTPPPTCSYSAEDSYQHSNSGVAEFLARQALQLAEPFSYQIPPNVAPLVIEDPPTESDGSSEDGNHNTRNSRSARNLLIGSAGNFSSSPGSLLGVTSGAGGQTPRSAPSTPQQLEAPLRSPSHSTAKYDKNGKNSWPSNDGAGGNEGPLAAPPSSSKARQKKFNRHFPQAAQDERVLNYYSCALVGDILLQGHLYITKNYFAFYSNVFGYVTKLLIPTATVLRVSKEKMARIIPNAVGVTTLEDKHVFGSLLSRDTTYKLMTQVWKASPVSIPANLPIDPCPLEPSEISDSSCGSQDDGEESNDVKGSRLTPPVHPRRTPSPKGNLAETKNSPIPGDEAPSENSNIKSIKLTTETDKIIPNVISTSVIRKPTAAVILSQNGSTLLRASKRKKSSSDGTMSSILNVLFNHSTLLVVATILLVLLFFSAGFLLYRIGIVSDKLGNHFAVDNDMLFLKRGDDFYSEILKWQSQLHSKSAVQVHDFLNSNLEQIAKVRQSLEMLSTLIGGVTSDNSRFTGDQNSDNKLDSDTRETVGMSRSSNVVKS